jgi:ASC-1-like (ASCH) protein
MANTHLVILKKQCLDDILSGKKTIESRLWQNKKASYGLINTGDKLFLKQSSGPVCATAQISAVKLYNNLTPEQILEIKKEYNDRIMGSDEYWQSKADCKYGVLIWLCNIKPIKPVMINKKDWRAWVVLGPGADYGLLKLTEGKDYQRV